MKVRSSEPDSEVGRRVDPIPEPRGAPAEVSVQGTPPVGLPWKQEKADSAGGEGKPHPNCVRGEDKKGSVNSGLWVGVVGQVRELCGPRCSGPAGSGGALERPRGPAGV